MYSVSLFLYLAVALLAALGYDHGCHRICVAVRDDVREAVPIPKRFAGGVGQGAIRIGFDAASGTWTPSRF